MKSSKILAGVTALALMAVTIIPAAQADHRDYYHDYYRYGGSNSGGFLREHPYVQKALIGGGVGALIGGLAGSEGSRTSAAIKGGLIGSAAGIGYEYLKRKRF